MDNQREEMLANLKKFITDMFHKYFGSKDQDPNPQPQPIPNPTPFPPPDGVPEIDGASTPDANGLVSLTGIPSTSVFSTYRYAIQEVYNVLPAGPAKDFVYANVRNANGLWLISKMVSPCYPVIGTGLEARVDPNGKPIQGTRAAPEALGGTVAQATTWFAALANPNGDHSGDFLPH